MSTHKTDQPNEDEQAASAADVEPSDDVEIDQTPRGNGRLAVWRRIKPVPVVLVLLLAVSGGLAAWLYFKQYRPDERTDAAAARSAIDAARDGTVALLSYKPDTLDQDFATAKSHLTGDFLNYYDKFTQQIVSPAAKQKALATTAQVVGAAVSEMHPNSAVVLVFVNQATTSKDRPDPAMASSSVLVSLTKVQGKWLITKFDPV
jgi:Mce-associated membrane protein